ncbi:AI-2E family transporter [Flavobacterium aurantiibacter]|uniref:AI-2E family transporter n=1 Tax=Flavobacterium aurantiibacter TaxID=2023067 RepID=A0A256A0Z8_9FLAO|nr:AI-2E family transporter [Flavobacterium aurantiibacter]OYQ47403.1 AI-2E family transporter [Flavobacterium aurantiibacter]
MTAKELSNGLLRTIFILAGIVAAYYFLSAISSVLMYLITALVLTLIGRPLLRFFKNKFKFSNNVAVVAVLFIYVSFIVGFIALLVPLIIEQGNHLAVLNIADIEKNVVSLKNDLVTFLEEHHINAADEVAKFNPANVIDFNFIPNLLNNLLGALGNIGMAIGSTLFITFFFLKDKQQIAFNIQRLIPKDQRERTANSIESINEMLSSYFVALLLQLGIVFVLYFIVLVIFGVPNALVIAFICAILNIIPYIGPLIASVLAALLTMMSHLGQDFQSEILPTTIYILIGFWIVQLIDNNVSQPLIFSKSTNSHPLEIFLVILIAGFLGGVLLMIAAVPLYTMLKIIAKEFFPNNKFVQILTQNM